MAQLRQQPKTDDTPAHVLTVRPWAPAAQNENVRLLLGDAHCPARQSLWAEIACGLDGAPFVYLRQPLQMADWACAASVQQLLRGDAAYALWRSGCPPAVLMARPGPEDPQGQPTFQVSLQLNVAGLTDRGPDSGLTLAVDGVSSAGLAGFAQALDAEIAQALAGQLPDPQPLAPGLAVNPFSSRVNASAYDGAAAGYGHDYLAEPFFRRAFDGWLGLLPPAARLLEIGCGHGAPIAAALDADGHRVTGIDPSAAMIAQARRTVPGGTFRRLALAELDESARFDGACCFFSLLCMDPIELRIGLARLHAALKPGAPVLIVSGVPDLRVRTSPLRTVQGRTTWEWPHDQQDIAAALGAPGGWEIARTDVQYYDVDTLQPLKETELYLSSADGPGLTTPVKGVYALLAHKTAG